MCGILCCISRDPPSIPRYFKQNIRNFDEDKVVWDTQDEAFIQTLIDDDLKQTEILSLRDQHKIKNLDKLRICNARLNQIKNTIGKSESHSSELVDARSKIELEMKLLTLIDDNIARDEMAEYASDESEAEPFLSLVPVIASRGPNYLKYISFHIKESQTWVEQFSSVLSLRQPFVQQPVQLENEQISVQFNGELYNQECLDSNDSKFIGDKIISNIEKFGDGDRGKAIVETIAELEGEFAYVIVDKANQRCFFGRDYVGKRSLVYSLKDSGRLVISSVTNGKSEDNWEECKAEVVYMYDFESCKLDSYELVLKGERHARPICNLALNKLEGTEVLDRISKFKEVFFEACKVRVDTIHPIHEDNPHITNLGILFSGGLDCTVIAGTVGELFLEMVHLDKTILIDLLTVGFDNPRTEVLASDSPDRKLAKKSWLELAKKFNSDSRISFRLVEVDVNYEEWLRHKSRVERLMYPCDTEMDLSIAIAFYFASRASNGVKLTLNPSTYEVETQENYTSKAKVLLSGLGADELFAGYLRHERVFNDLKPDSSSDVLEKAYSDLADELTNDIKVIYKRNLGRDDRVIALWGKELRYPFLEEKVINYVVQQVELDLKFNYLWETTTNKKGKVSTRLKPVRKWILREFAETLGLTGVKNELKRAIQFGAKSAKMEIGQGKTKGTDQL